MTNINKNHKIKLIVSDLDGTLLHTDKTISKYTRDTLKKCRNAGIYLAFATARPIRGVAEYLDIIKPTGRIYHNGALVYYNNDLLSANQIDSSTTTDIIEKIKSRFPKLKIACEMDDNIYANFDTSIMWKATEHVLTDFTDIPQHKADKIIVNIENNVDILRDINSFKTDDVYIEIADSYLAFFMNINASKQKAVSTLCNKLNITINNVLSFGDDNNDIGMIKLCGTGVAMQNANDQVKLAADYICGSNDEDGVARWIVENVL